MTIQHPITPPPKLVQQWTHEAIEAGMVDEEIFATRAAQWGADQELEACCTWFVQDWTDIETADKLRAARRPKPPSLKEEALEALEGIDGYAIDQLSAYVIHKELKQYANTIRRALEALPND